MQQLPLKIAGQKANGFFPLKSSTPMAQFRLSNTKVALHGKHLKGRGRHRPTMKKGVAGSLQVGNQGRVSILLPTAGQGAQPAAPTCQWAGSRAPAAHCPYCCLSSTRGCSPSSTGSSKCRQTGRFHSFCSESQMCHYNTMLIAKSQLYVPICA